VQIKQEPAFQRASARHEPSNPPTPIIIAKPPHASVAALKNAKQGTAPAKKPAVKRRKIDEE
jgi:hypothetical protein